MLEPDMRAIETTARASDGAPQASALAPAVAARAPTEAAVVASERAPDLFALGREAAAIARRLHEGRATFARSRQLLTTGAWRGPRDAADAFVDAEDLPAFGGGGLAAARAAGARTLIAPPAAAATIGEALDAGWRCLVRVGFRGGESWPDRAARIDEMAALLRSLARDRGDGAAAVDGVVPTPEGEALGLDTLELVALCRVRLRVPHVVVDFAHLGHRLAQMALGFGADELLGPIVAERALRLGTNAGNPALTRKEAALLIRAAGLAPWERVTGGALEEVAS
jgi:hypothetical protein